MKDSRATKSIHFYLIMYSVLCGLIFVLQLLFSFHTVLNKIVLYLSLIGLLIIIFQIRFIKYRYRKELELLRRSVKLVIERNFSRKYKLHRIPTEDEIGEISNEVSKMLEKLHDRTTEVLQKRMELADAGKNIEKLGSIGRDITSRLTLNQIIQTTFENLNQLLDASLLAIGIWDSEKKGLHFYGIRQGSSEVVHGFEDMTDERRWGVYCFNNQQEVFCNHFDTCSKQYFSALLFKDSLELRQSFIYLPLTLREQKIGVFTVQSFKQDAYTVYHLNLLRNLANYLNIAITNAKAFQQIESQKEKLTEISVKLKNSQLYLEQQVLNRTQKLNQQKLEIEKKNIELERLSLVARKTNNAIMIMDASGNIEWINDCFSRIYNYTFEEFVNKRGKNILQTSFHPEIEQVMKKCLTTRKAVFYEAANITGDGREIWTQTTLTPVLNNYGEITHLLTIDSDISKRKEYELTLTRQARDIKQSILYAKQIQQAVFPPLQWFDLLLKNYFVLFKPKDIVSGDFYWIGRRGNKVMVALGDCTGHGVPGAFMSMLGISLLNELVHSNEWETAGELLGVLRSKVKLSLRQDHNDYTNADGMDLSVCIIDKNDSSIQFAGANSSIFVIRKNELEQIKGNKMPIGLYIDDNMPFTTNNIRYSSEDKFYLSSDGYSDQFGGERDSKFTMKRFRDLLLDIHQLSFEVQKNILDEKISLWQGNNVQIDDICVIGFNPA